MGAALHSVREMVTVGDAEDKAMKLEQLTILEKMASDHLRAIENDVINGKRGDQQIHSGTVVQRETYKGVQIEEKSDAADRVGNIIGDFFSLEIIKGIKGVIQTGTDIILGNTAVGESEYQQMLVLWENNALIRVDIYYWRYNFSSKQVMSCCDSVFAGFLMKRVVNIGNIDPPVLAFSITRAARSLGKDDSDIKKDVDKAIELNQQVTRLMAGRSDNPFPITGNGEPPQDRN